MGPCGSKRTHQNEFGPNYGSGVKLLSSINYKKVINPKAGLKNWQEM
jgi:hypothetical protein